jgi:hypothetical protein
MTTLSCSYAYVFHIDLIYDPYSYELEQLMYNKSTNYDSKKYRVPLQCTGMLASTCASFSAMHVGRAYARSTS